MTALGIVRHHAAAMMGSASTSDTAWESGCVGEGFVLESAYDDNQNEAGGDWFPFSERVPLRLSRGAWILAARKSDGSIVQQRILVLAP